MADTHDVADISISLEKVKVSFWSILLFATTLTVERVDSFLYRITQDQAQDALFQLIVYAHRQKLWSLIRCWLPNMVLI